MKRYSFRIIVASVKEDIQKLFPEHQAYGIQILRLLNDPANGIPQNMKLLAAWCFLEPNTSVPVVRHVIEHIIYEKITYKVSPKSKTVTLGLSEGERTFSKPSELIAFLDAQVRTSVAEVSIETDIEPLLQSADGRIKIFKVFGENAPQIAKKLAGDTTWCITKPNSGMYYFYRNQTGSTFYFVFDENMKGTPLEKVAVDLNTSKKSQIVRLTDLNNRTGENLTSDVPGSEGTDWKAYSSYLTQSGIDLDEQDENGQNKLRREPLTQVEVEEQKLLGEAVSSLEDFKKLFTNENIRRNFPSKYLVRGHGLTNEQFDWLLDNQTRVNTAIIFQYLESAQLPDEQIQKIKKFPKFLKRLKEILFNSLEATGYMRTDLKNLFTPEELKQADLSKNKEGIFFFPANYLNPEEIETEFEKDPDLFIKTMMENRRFDVITPKIKDKIYEISINKGINLLYYPYHLFFPKATLSELAQYIAKFPDTIYGQLAMPEGILLSASFLKLLSSLGYNAWTKMFSISDTPLKSFLGNRVPAFVSLLEKDITFLSLFPKEDIPKKHINDTSIEEYIAKHSPDIFQQIISNPAYASKFNRLKLLQFSKFPVDKHHDEYDKWDLTRTKHRLDMAYKATPQLEMGELPEETPEKSPEETQENPMVGLMKKLDDSGMYGVADKVQNLWKRTVDKTKESLDKLS
jgi:hypothetical protein